MPRRKSKNALDAAATPACPPSPGTALIVRGAETGAVTLTDAGLALVEQTARDGGTRHLCASRLGIARSTFIELMRRDERAVLAFERGEAELESEVGGLLLTAARKGHVVSAIFYSKARLGWRENDVVPQSQVGIQIVLPDSLSPDAWAERQRARAVALSAPTDVVDVEVKEIIDGK